MMKIAVVYHSGYGHTKALAKSVAKGIQNSKAEALWLSVDELSNNMSELKDVAGIIFGSPTYMGSVSGDFKKFMDKTSEIWMNQDWKDKLAAGFTTSASMSGDKFNTLMQICTFACQHSMIWLSLGQMDQSSPFGDPSAINRLGSYLGGMAQSNNDAPENNPPLGDHKTMELLGERMVHFVKKLS